jgi:ankyrin repeat protein
MDWRLLHNACWDGDAKKVARLLDRGADANQRAPTVWRQRPLHRTLEFRIGFPKHPGHVEVVQLLLAAGANARLRATSLDLTPYELACFCGLEAAARLLREAQRSAPPLPEGLTPLWLAAATRFEEDHALRSVRRLLKKAPPLDAVWRGATPLQIAVGHAGNFLVGELLLKSGADINAGCSLLHASCSWHLEHLVPGLEWMSGHGWDINARDPEEGMTALEKARFLRYSNAERLLLRLGAR